MKLSILLFFLFLLGRIYPISSLAECFAFPGDQLLRTDLSPYDIAQCIDWSVNDPSRTTFFGNTPGSPWCAAWNQNQSVQDVVRNTPLYQSIIKICGLR